MLVKEMAQKVKILTLKPDDLISVSGPTQLKESIDFYTFSSDLSMHALVCVCSSTHTQALARTRACARAHTHSHTGAHVCRERESSYKRVTGAWSLSITLKTKCCWFFQ